MAIRISRSQRLMAVIGIASIFFLAEISGMHLSLFLLFLLGMSWLGKSEAFSLNFRDIGSDEKFIG